MSAALARVVIDPATAAYVRSLLPRNVHKYWLQRYSLFNRFDEGVQLDTEVRTCVYVTVTVCDGVCVCLWVCVLEQNTHLE